ncbi:NADP-dependent oxidoreductase [Alphaproteobacteria bacterium]|nr:NADP-dependent oxidoreductase [Alphaproteobacteria bacterium]
MRAIGHGKYGGPEVLEMIEVPEVNAGKGEVRIRIHAAAVNPTDIMSRNGSHSERQKVDPFPYVPGMDIAGIVDQIGHGVDTGVSVGDRVIAMVVPKGIHGAYREQIVLKANAVVAAPRNTSHVEACTLPMNSLTARLSLDLMGLQAGSVLAVTGSAGAYGGYIIELAKNDGLTVIADAADKDYDLVKSLGADYIVPRGPNVASAIRKEFPEGVDGIADGAVQNEIVIAAVRNGGAFTAVRGFKGEPERSINFSQTFVRNYDGEFEKLNQLRKLVDEQKLTLRMASTYKPENVSAAHERLEAGGTRGRLVIEFYPEDI